MSRGPPWRALYFPDRFRQTPARSPSQSKCHWGPWCAGRRLLERTGWVTRPALIASRARRADLSLTRAGQEPLPIRSSPFLSAREGSSMGHVRLSEHIDAPIDHVWDINASCERLPEWNVNIVEVKDCQGRLDRVGARATTVVRVFGRRIDGSQETMKADKPHAFALKLVGAGGA